MSLDFSRLRSVTHLDAHLGEEDSSLAELSSEAREYLESHPWCRRIGHAYLGYGVAYVVGVFLFEVEIEQVGREWLWVVVGDLPSAYLVTDHARDACTALESYADLMDDWVDAVRTGGAMDDVFPVDAPADEAHAGLLADRVRFLREDIVPACRADC